MNRQQDESYQVAKEKATRYFKTLQKHIVQKDYIYPLTQDIQSWKHHHTSIFSTIFTRKKESQGYERYIRWLESANKLEPYLDRSISYIFLRDLGQSLASEKTQTRIETVVQRIKRQLTEKNSHQEMFSMAWIYRRAQKEGIESTVIWLNEKLKIVASNIPEEMNRVEGMRKLIKIIAGVLIHEIEEMGEQVPSEVRARNLDKAIRLGYCYGLTYLFIYR